MKTECEKCCLYDMLNQSMKLNQEIRKGLYKNLGYDVTSKMIPIKLNQETKIFTSCS